MYKSYLGNEIKSREEEILKFDSSFEINEKGLYYTVENKKGIFGYVYILPRENEFILKNIFITKEKRYLSYGTKLLFFVINKKFYKKKIIVENSKNITGFLKKCGFKSIRNNLYVYDASENREKRKRESKKVVTTSIFWNIILALTKISAGLIGKSQALLADGFNSLSDIATSIGILLGLHFSNVPKDDAHPFGHEKIESVIGVIMGILMIITAFELAHNGIKILFDGDTRSKPEIMTIYFAGFSAIVKYFMYKQKMNYGIKSENSALIADAKDSKNDVYSSVGVIIGIVLSIYINPIFDTIISIVVSILILKEGVSVIFETTDTILDKQDNELLSEIKKYIYENTNIENIHDIVMRKSGDKIFLQFHIRIPGETTVYEAHKISDDLEASIIQDFKNVESVNIHLDCLKY